MNALELKVPTVLQVLATGAAMYGVSKTLPALQFSISDSKWLGGGLAIIGLGIGVMGVTEFKKAQTTVNPHTPERSEHLVTSGIYQYSRNPMYVGLVFILLGWALYLSHLIAFALIIIFIKYMSRFQIQAEEKIMTEKFGDKYKAYLVRVRRWI
ncbi:isoprenylcysteine carboxylmethyltransferase family protein [Psychrobacter frigidicola]|uniref:Isoprenylcysteine carboxylmethyltransferase family protein n=1 Tax=Psychrobacter frigidicola TaxID=45611 RepID=A0A5C7A3N8_9GAMM|nr:isoprenylcysteine carboxylmethyltransferase family protein [Psychrobacter frigidicola]TXD98021.1 isoprenylcysteine carboxylmethyltransferase family protein [Psychrobacter frigidicola]